MSDKLSRRDFIKLAAGGVAIGAGLTGIGKVAVKVGEAFQKASFEEDQLKQADYVAHNAEVVPAEENLEKRVKDKFNLEYTTSSFALKCRGTTLSNFILAPQSDDSQKLAIYTDMGGGEIAELRYSVVYQNVVWKLQNSENINPKEDTSFEVLTYPLEANGESDTKINYNPPHGQQEKIGFKEGLEINFHFSSNDLPEMAQKALRFK